PFFEPDLLNPLDLAAHWLIGGKRYRVPPWELFSGYTFPTVINPLSGEVEPWSGQTVRLDPLAPITSAIDSLTAQPSGITTVSPEEVITAVTGIADALYVMYYPFVSGSYVFDPELNTDKENAEFWLKLAPYVCDCDPLDKPYPVPTTPNLHPTDE